MNKYKIGVTISITAITLLVVTAHMDVPVSNPQTPPENTKISLSEDGGEGNIRCALWQEPYKTNGQGEVMEGASCYATK